MRALGAAVVALVLAVLAGSGVAAATQICEPAGSGGDGRCPNGSAEALLPKGASFKAESTDVVLTSLTAEVSCSTSTLAARLTSENGIPLLKGKITALSFAGCETAGATPCEVTVANLPYETVFHKTDIIVFDDAGEVIRLNCGFLVSCEFEAQEHLLEPEGDLLAASEERPYAKRGAFCPVGSRLDATYAPLRELTFSP